MVNARHWHTLQQDHLSALKAELKWYKLAQYRQAWRQLTAPDPDQRAFVIINIKPIMGKLCVTSANSTVRLTWYLR